METIGGARYAILDRCLLLLLLFCFFLYWTGMKPDGGKGTTAEGLFGRWGLMIGLEEGSVNVLWDGGLGVRG